jgi:hypothetical protein
MLALPEPVHLQVRDYATPLSAVPAPLLLISAASIYVVRLALCYLARLCVYGSR